MRYTLCLSLFSFLSSKLKLREPVANPKLAKLNEVLCSVSPPASSLQNSFRFLIKNRFSFCNFDYIRFFNKSGQIQQFDIGNRFNQNFKINKSCQGQSQQRKIVST